MESVREEDESQDEDESAEGEEMDDDLESTLGNESDEIEEAEEDSAPDRLSSIGRARPPGTAKEDDDGRVHNSRSSHDSPSGSGTSDAESDRSRRSLAPSPTASLVARAASLSLNPGEGPDPANLVSDDERPEESELAPVSEKTAFPAHGRAHTTIKERVVSDIARQHARQGKYHSKRRVRKIGRPKGSKAKQDLRIKLDRNTVWE